MYVYLGNAGYKIGIPGYISKMAVRLMKVTIYNKLFINKGTWGRDLMVVGFTTTNVICAYHH